jgi:hypothetical protein
VQGTAVSGEESLTLSGPLSNPGEEGGRKAGITTTLMTKIRSGELNQAPNRQPKRVSSSNVLAQGAGLYRGARSN